MKDVWYQIKSTPENYRNFINSKKYDISHIIDIINKDINESNQKISSYKTHNKDYQKQLNKLIYKEKKLKEKQKKLNEKEKNDLSYDILEINKKITEIKVCLLDVDRDLEFTKSRKEKIFIGLVNRLKYSSCVYKDELFYVREIYPNLNKNDSFEIDLGIVFCNKNGNYTKNDIIRVSYQDVIFVYFF
jgi:hypothetical protein